MVDEREDEARQVVPIYVGFYLGRHARHDPIHIEEYSFLFASKNSLHRFHVTVSRYLSQSSSTHSEWKNCMHLKDIK